MGAGWAGGVGSFVGAAPALTVSTWVALSPGTLLIFKMDSLTRILTVAVQFGETKHIPLPQE